LLVGFKLRKYHFYEEISDLKQGETTFQNILKISYFVIHFFKLTSQLCEEKQWKEYKFNEILFITQHERATRKNMDEKVLLKYLHLHAYATEWRFWG